MKRETTPDRRFSRSHRVIKSSIFREAFQNDRQYRGKFMVMWLRSGQDAGLRLGVVAGKRSFRKAVERARAKRLLREAYRLNRFRFHGDYDVILMARRRMMDVSRHAVEKELLALAEKAGILGNAECGTRSTDCPGVDMDDDNDK